MGHDREGAGGHSQEPFGQLLSELEARVAAACEGRDEWPAKVGAGIYAGVEFAISHPTVADALLVLERTDESSTGGYTGTLKRLAALISRDAPEGSRLPGSTDEALMAGIVGLVGDHVRLGRFEALEALRPDLVLLALLPYLGFADAQRWANQFGSDQGED
jgi:hypothetical protein